MRVVRLYTHHHLAPNLELELDDDIRHYALNVLRLNKSSSCEIMGATNPADAAPGTIRADFANSVEENAAHGSDGPDTAEQEIAFFFGEDGICERTR